MESKGAHMEETTRMLSLLKFSFDNLAVYLLDTIVVSIIYNGIKHWIPNEGNVELNG